MNATASPVASQQESLGARLRNFTIGAAFVCVLLIPRVLRLRHNPRSWLAFRVALGALGAALVVLPLSIANSWEGAVSGLAMFLLAILLPPAKPDLRIDEKSKELATLVVVNGGFFDSVTGGLIPVHLFVGKERIHAMDSNLHPLGIIPVAEISSCNATETGEHWILRIRWSERTADFVYRGVFAEHLARVAEATVRSVMYTPLPILQQSRAASA